jgi:hypothetical protein
MMTTIEYADSLLQRADCMADHAWRLAEAGLKSLAQHYCTRSHTLTCQARDVLNNDEYSLYLM